MHPLELIPPSFERVVSAQLGRNESEGFRVGGLTKGRRYILQQNVSGLEGDGRRYWATHDARKWFVMKERT